MKHDKLLDQLRVVESKQLDPDAHMLAQLAVIMLEYRRRIAARRGVSDSDVTVDDLIDAMLRGAGIEGVSHLDKQR